MLERREVGFEPRRCASSSGAWLWTTSTGRGERARGSACGKGRRRERGVGQGGVRGEEDLQVGADHLHGAAEALLPQVAPRRGKDTVPLLLVHPGRPGLRGEALLAEERGEPGQERNGADAVDAPLLGEPVTLQGVDLLTQEIGVLRERAGGGPVRGGPAGGFAHGLQVGQADRGGGVAGLGRPAAPGVVERQVGEARQGGGGLLAGGGGGVASVVGAPERVRGGLDQVGLAAGGGVDEGAVFRGKAVAGEGEYFVDLGGREGAEEDLVEGVEEGRARPRSGRGHEVERGERTTAGEDQRQSPVLGERTQPGEEPRMPPDLLLQEVIKSLNEEYQPAARLAHALHEQFEGASLEALGETGLVARQEAISRLAEEAVFDERVEDVRPEAPAIEAVGNARAINPAKEEADRAALGHLGLHRGGREELEERGAAHPGLGDDPDRLAVVGDEADQAVPLKVAADEALGGDGVAVQEGGHGRDPGWDREGAVAQEGSGSTPIRLAAPPGRR